MANIFSSIKLFKPKRSFVDLTHDVKYSCNLGQLVPTCFIDCVPGDKFTISSELFTRFAPMVAPVMHRFDSWVHYFYVPYRLLWENWEEFISNTPTDSGPHILPYTTWSGDIPVGMEKLGGYLTLPPRPVLNSYQICAFPFAAYFKIYNEYYRDQNLQSEIFPDGLVDGDNSTGINTYAVVQNRAWEHDYFTSCLPFAQKGQAVTMPIGSIEHNVQVLGNSGAGSTTLTGSPFSPTIGTALDADIASDLYAQTQGLNIDAGTINDFRRATALQRFLEINARGGTRYKENILAHFGVRSSDKRLQRPEYITGVKSPITVSEVVNTTGSFSGTDATSPVQGSMAGHAVGVAAGKYGSYFCEEHGCIIGIASVMPKSAYQQGIPRFFLYKDVTDFYWPSFQHLGEQEVVNAELYVDHSVPTGTFGYLPRYAEHKFQSNRVAGDFRTTLSQWHAGRIFAGEQNLNPAFIECSPQDSDINRIFAVEDPTIDHLYCHCLNKIGAKRPMSKFASPI